MMHSVLISKKYRLLMQNFLFIEGGLKSLFLGILSNSVNSCTFFIEKIIVEGVPTNIGTVLITLRSKSARHTYSRVDQTYVLYLTIMTAIII